MIDLIRKLGVSVLLTLVLVFLLLGAIIMGQSAEQTVNLAADPVLPSPTSTFVIVVLTSEGSTPEKRTDSTETTASATPTIENTPGPQQQNTAAINTVTATPTRTNSPTATKLSSVCEIPTGWVMYTVQSGDNLYRIGLKYRVSTNVLQQANCMGNRTTIIAGEKLWVPNVATSTPQASTTPTRLPASSTPVGTSTATTVPTNTNTPEASLTPEVTEP